VSTSEVLTLQDRNLLASAFGAPVYDEYGCGEVGPILYQCEKGRLHLMAENLEAELLPDPTPDEPGACRLVVTDLHNLATPLLRYDLGDRVVPAPACDCRRTLPAFARVFGRAYDFVEIGDGARFHGEFFLYVLEWARDRGLPILQAQFVQTGPSEIELRVVPGRGFGAEASELVAAELAARSGHRLRGRTEIVREIPRERSGKLRLIKALPPADGPSR
jgi:phenylacetate-CoA ligase